MSELILSMVQGAGDGVKFSLVRPLAKNSLRENINIIDTTILSLHKFQLARWNDGLNFRILLR